MRVFVVVFALLVACGTKTPAPPPKPPDPPTGLTATGGAGQISLSWTGSAGATSYNVLRGDSPRTEANPVASAVTSYDDTGLAPGKTYYYVVQAVGPGGTSGNSNEVSATTVPPGPASLTATGGVGQVALSWTAVSGATGGYSVSRGTAAGGPYAEIAAAAAGTTYVDKSVGGGTTYYYVVQGITAQGKTDNSPEASALTAPDAPTGVSVLATDVS